MFVRALQEKPMNRLPVLATKQLVVLCQLLYKITISFRVGALLSDDVTRLGRATMSKSSAKSEARLSSVKLG